MTVPAGAALFETPIGRCGIGWHGNAVCGVQLPERSDEVTLRRVRAKVSQPEDGEIPETINAAIEAMRSLLEGEPLDLRFIDVDLDSPSPFDAAVWEVTRSIDPGQSLTYGEVAERIGQPQAAQAVGRSLGANPCPIVVPCHRVLGADGRLVGFSANGGTATKRKMLLIEGCPAVPPSLFD